MMEGDNSKSWPLSSFGFTGMKIRGKHVNNGEVFKVVFTIYWHASHLE